MPTFEQLRAQYMADSFPGVRTGSGGGSSSQPPPVVRVPIDADCAVTPLVNGPAYFRALEAAIAKPDVEFIHLAGWWLGSAFALGGPAHASRFVDLLAAKSRAGVDVRVLGWVMAPEVLQSAPVRSHGGSIPGLAGLVHLNGDTMQFVNTLRAEPSMAHKACLNILSHPAGAIHLKFAVVGTARQTVGFTGGIDLEASRHQPWWRDVQAKVEGPVVQRFYDLFRELWEEVRGRTPVTLTANRVTCASHTSSTPAIAARTVPSSTTKRMHVQSAQTLPQFNFGSGAIGSLLPRNLPLSFAPAGRFEVGPVWRRGVGGAERYLYMEDQAFTSTEVFDWINGAVKADDDLKVILLIGGNDPTAPAPGTQMKAMRVAINDHLLAGLSAAQIARIGFFGYWHTFVHSKTTIVDDQWALIGSANCMRRSLYTDFEHAVGFMDADGVAVPAYRRDLWSTHLPAVPADPDAAVAAWFALPFRSGGPPPPGSPDPVRRIRLPLPAATLTSRERLEYDYLIDPDSRQVWGPSVVSLFTAAGGVGSLSP